MSGVEGSGEQEAGRARAGESVTEQRRGLKRRAFLRNAGLSAVAVPAAAGLTGRRDRAAAAVTGQSGQGPYQLETPYWQLQGSYGKLTSVAVDPSGTGNYQTPGTFQAVYLGQTDLYQSPFNTGVTWETTATSLHLAGISVGGPAYSVSQGVNTGAPPALTAGQTLGQTFTVAAGANITAVSFLLATFGAPSAGITITLYQGTPAGSLQQVATETLTIQDNTTYSLTFAPQPAGTYYLEASNPVGTPTWWYHQGGATAVGGTAYLNRAPLTDTNFVFTASGFTGGGVATWDLVVDGGKLSSSYTVAAAASGATVTDAGLTLLTPWQQDGYSIAYDDGVLFSRFYTDAGQYMPAQQLKRQPSWGTSWSMSEWVYATGTGSYDLRLSTDDFSFTGTMTASVMTLGVTPANASPSATVSRSATLDLLPHSDAVPAAFPVFVASDGLRASQLSQFYYERAFSFPFGQTAVDWKDWLGRSVDWADTGGAAAERSSILSNKMDDDGYVWTWSTSPDWPFPNPDLYDARHFTSNAMYILGTWRYYSWTGDEDFLATMMPRVRSALDFYLTTLDGSSGIVTITSQDHTGLDQSLSSNYWDITAFGHLDAYLNAYFYGALGAMAELEDQAGNASRATQLRTLQATTKSRYNELFWDDAAGRYIQTIDVDGNPHDYGASYVNLEAASWGLPSPEQARRIFSWLEHGATELRENVLFVSTGSIATPIAAGQTQGQVFTTTASFTTVAIWLPTFSTRGPQFTLTLYQGGPGGTSIASQRFTDWGDGATAHLTFGEQPAGTYYLELSDPSGQLAWWSTTASTPGVRAYANGQPATDVAARNLAVLGPYTQGPADIYTRWGWAPRTTSRKNDFWYYFGWIGVTVPWAEQLQDGGADLYISGFDVLARASYLSADDAWQRLTAVLDRWSEPDHLCGGSPLYNGEIPQGAAAGAVGTDNPFPESGVTPASFLYAFVGVEAHTSGLAITPNLPSDLAWAGVQNLYWRSRHLDVLVTTTMVTVTGPGVSLRQSYRPGESVWLPAPS